MACGCASEVCGCEDVTLPTGEQGYNGWLPILANVEDAINLDDKGNTRIIQQITGWTGGSGPTPTVFIDYYIGETGPIVDIADGVNIRGDNGRNYKAYVAKISQVASGVPLEDILFENNLGGTFNFSRTSTGNYVMTFTDTWEVDKVAVFISGGVQPSVPKFTLVNVQSISQINILTYENGVLDDSGLNHFIEVRIYD